jgi:basic amino acid/polyamine antiporter, APA family
VTPVLSVAACIWVLSGLHWTTWVWFGIWVGVALLFYLFWSRHHSALNDGGDGIIATAAPGVEDAR